MPIDLFEALESSRFRYGDAAFGDLPEVDRVLTSIWWLEADVNNGGFDQYYFNSSGDSAYYAPLALRTIGAPIMAGIVEKANSRFGPGGPPPCREERQEALLAMRDGLWDDLDDQFYAYPEDLSALLEAFLESR
jgi:hypothetical protein